MTEVTVGQCNALSELGARRYDHPVNIFGPPGNWERRTTFFVFQHQTRFECRSTRELSVGTF